MGLGDKAAMLIYPATSQRKGQPEYRALMSTTYERVEDEWLVKLHQQTPIRQASRRGALGDPGTGGMFQRSGLLPCASDPSRPTSPD
jgi:hypothetical protein